MPVVLLAWRKYLPARRRRGSPSPAPTHGSPCPATPRTAGGLSASSFGRVRLRFGQLLNRRLLKRVSGLWLATWRQSAPARYVSPRLAVHRHTNKENSEPCRTIAITRNSEPPGSGATFSHYTCRGEDRPAAGAMAAAFRRAPGWLQVPRSQLTAPAPQLRSCWPPGGAAEPAAEVPAVRQQRESGRTPSGCSG
jgi:hypothetical protein